ncbi:hypothetical protein DENIT_20079 [Pseudomonas veronii]|nr:hypothetical protein DENIT_20079 [Pseudomonas veronii]
MAGLQGLEPFNPLKVFEGTAFGYLLCFELSHEDTP